jgi:hypothetical protein
MVRAMRALASDGERRRRYAARGAEWVERQYGPRPVVDALLRVIGHARGAPSRSDLGAAIRGDGALVSSVSDRQVRDLLRQAAVAPSLRQRALMRLVHVPWVYRLYLRVRDARRARPA